MKIGTITGLCETGLGLPAQYESMNTILVPFSLGLSVNWRSNCAGYVQFSLLVPCWGLRPVRSRSHLVWFDGSFQAALTEAAERDTVVMVEFYTDWCNWCRRLESDTLTNPEVRAELAKLVALKLDAEKSGAEMAARYGIDSYPTMIFFDARGNEMERILGYLPPDKVPAAGSTYPQPGTPFSPACGCSRRIPGMSTPSSDRSTVCSNGPIRKAPSAGRGLSQGHRRRTARHHADV